MTISSSISVRIGGYIASVPNLAVLRNYPTTDLRENDTILVGGSALAGDTNGGAYIWQPSATDADNGTTLIRPSNGSNSGRWKQSIGKGIQGIQGIQGPIGDVTPAATQARVDAQAAASAAAISATTSTTKASESASSATTATGSATAASNSAVAAAASAATTNGNDPALLPLQDYFRPDRVITGYPEAGVMYSGGSYDNYRYIILPAKALTPFQVNKPIGDAGGFNRVEFYSTPTITTTGYLGNWSNAAQTTPFTDLTPITNARIVVFRFLRNRIIGSDSYALSIDTDFKILPAGTGSEKPRAWGRFISKPDVQPMLGDTIGWMGDSRFKNGTYNTLKRITVELGMVLGIKDAQGLSDIAKSGRTMDKALYRADDVTELTTTDIQGVRQIAINFGHNDLFKSNPGLPTAANIAAKIGSFTDSPSATISPSGVASATTMCGKARTVLAWLLAQNPRLKITWASTYYTNSPVASFGLTQGQVEQWLLAWRDELERLCTVTGVGFHDWMKSSKINRYNFATYLEDGIHMIDTPADRNSATPSGYDMGMVSQWVQYYNHNGIPFRALAPYENVPG